MGNSFQQPHKVWVGPSITTSHPPSGLWDEQDWTAHCRPPPSPPQHSLRRGHMTTGKVNQKSSTRLSSSRPGARPCGRRVPLTTFFFFIQRRAVLRMKPMSDSSLTGKPVTENPRDHVWVLNLAIPGLLGHLSKKIPFGFELGFHHFQLKQFWLINCQREILKVYVSELWSMN